MRDVTAALNALEREGCLGLHHEKCVRVMFEWCNLVRHLMSPVIVTGLELAQRYWGGTATKAELDEMRVECWRDLDSMDVESRHVDPRYLSGRAAICVLFPEFPDEGESEAEHMYWCLDFANRAEDHSLDQLRLLLSEFGAVRRGSHTGRRE